MPSQTVQSGPSIQQPLTHVPAVTHPVARAIAAVVRIVVKFLFMIHLRFRFTGSKAIHPDESDKNP